MKSIFIQIASYRDLDLPNTVKDAISQSSGKYSLHFGIHNCAIEDPEFSNGFQDLQGARITELRSVAPWNIGAQTARYWANKMYSEEDFYLQVDAHSRFKKNWDDIFVRTLEYYQELGIKKPLISQYPAAFSYDENMNEVFTPSREAENPGYFSTRISFHEKPEQFDESLIPSQMAMPSPPMCGFTYSVSAGLIFTLGEFAEIEPNPKIAFWGEETLIAARAFTHGFDLVTPLQDIVWHLYHSGQSVERVLRKHAWHDFAEQWSVLDMLSRQEYKSIMRNRTVGRYALGSERSLDEYEQFAGLDFRTGKITQIDLR